MGILTEEDKLIYWKLSALLLVREMYKSKICGVQDFTKRWKVTERQAFRRLAETDALHKRLVGFFLM